MGSMALIAAKCSDGKYRRIICGNDDYLGYTGKVLDEVYKEQEKVDALMKLGDLRLLGASLEHTVNDWGIFGTCPPVKSGMATRCVVYSDGFLVDGIKSDPRYDEFDSEDDLIDAFFHLDKARMDYNYYFKDGQWYFFDWIDESAFDWVPLGSDDARRIELDRR